MTAVVKKGAGRASHTARTAKAAQRTPLPPKGATSGEGKNMTAKIISEEASKVKAKKTAKSAKAKAPKFSETSSPAPQPVQAEANPENKGIAKAKVFAEKAVSAGWEPGDLEFPAPDLVTITVRHEDEEICASWIRGIVTQDTVPTYTNGSGRHVKLRNISAAVKQMTLGEDSRPVREITPRAPRKGKRAPLDPEDLPRKRVPFNVETATDEEVLSAVRGRRIKWLNKEARSTQETVIPGNSKSLSISKHPKRETRILNFYESRGGQRTVALDRLTFVGK